MRKFLLSLWNGSRCGWMTWVCYRCGKFQAVIFLLLGVISSSCSWKVLETPLLLDMELVYTSELRCLMVHTHQRWSCQRLVWLLSRLWQYHTWSSWDLCFVLGWCILCMKRWNVQMFPSGVGRTPWWHSVGSEVFPPSGSSLWLTEYERSRIWLIPVNGSTAVESSTLLILSPEGWELRSWCLQNFGWRVLSSWFIHGQNHASWSCQWLCSVFCQSGCWWESFCVCGIQGANVSQHRRIFHACCGHQTNPIGTQPQSCRFFL